MYYTDDPARDMEMEYASRVEIIGVCPFCREYVLANDDYYHSNDWKDVAHYDCIMQMQEEVNRFL